MSRLEAFGVEGLGEVSAGDDVAALIVAAASLLDGDVLVVSSKILSKAEGRVVRAGDRSAAIDGETVRVVAERVTPRGLTRIVESRSGPVLAAAGVDNSNVAPGTVLLLPADPDASARAVRARVRELTGARVGVIVSDTAGRAWRDGQVDIAIGAAGVAVTDDLRGSHDPHGQLLEATIRALADELASLADLVKGKLAGVPVAVVRGVEDLVMDDDGPGASSLLRRPAEDWFRHGHVEAVRSALGVPPETVPRKDFTAPTVPQAPVGERLRRALDVALASPDPITGDRTWTDGVQVAEEIAADTSVTALTVTLPPFARDDVTRSLVRVGALVQRITAAAWSEDLQVAVTLAPRLDEDPRAVRLEARSR